MTVMSSPRIVDAYPLAALQAGMLYHSRFAEGVRTYHDVLTLTIESTVDTSALAAALAEVVRRHPVLRTGFDLTGFTEPIQLVYDDVEPELAVDDLSHLSEDEAAARVRVWGDEQCTRAFDWARPPLLRANVHLLAPRRFALTLAFHHAILDGWSVATLVTELLGRYAAHLAGNPLPVTPPGASFRDFVADEARAVASADTRAFWADALRDAPLTRLPRDPRAAADTTGDDRLDTVIDGDLVRRLTAIASDLRVPLRTVLLAAHVRVLALLSGDQDVVTGVLTNGRPESEASGEVLGLFLNTLPLRVKLGRRSWSDLVLAVFDAESAVLPHRRFPLFELGRLTGRTPLVDVVFDYRDFHAYRQLPGQDEVRILERRHRESTDLPLGVSFVRNQRDGRLHLYLSYGRREFTDEQVDRMHRTYLRGLTDLVADPAGPAWRTAPYLGAGTSRLVGPPAAARPAETLPGLVLAAAQEHPDACAVLDGEQAMTYRDLLTRAGSVAAALHDAGVRPGDPVGVYVPRSADFVVALVGVLLAGAAVLPLEVEYPDARLTTAFADAGATALVATAEGKEVVDALAPTVTVLIGDLPAAQRPDVVPHPDDTAYLLYTSGSTGVPKGVQLSHGPLVEHARWTVRSLGVGPGDRVAQRCPSGFDGALFELMTAWCAGATTVVLPTEVAANPDRLADRLAETATTLLTLVPGLLSLHIEAGTFRDLRALRTVVCAGEALGQSTVDAFAGQSSAALVNLYEPTECAIGVTEYRAVPGEHNVTVPIGRPNADVTLYVLDGNGELQPPGAPGELYVGGRQHARGYVGAGGLTADRFVPDHLSGIPGARLYRTGDRVRLLPGGHLEFLGRLDGQLKMNGVRVEAAEVEAVLAGHSDVQQAAVVVRHDGERRRLVAYVAPRQGLRPSERDLRAFLRLRLHEAMLPSRFVVLDVLPLLPNGKLDRAALPPPSAPTGETAAGPRDQVEARLVVLWQDVLGLGAVGIHDDFFALGGHSLLALRMAMRIQQEFDREVPVSTVLTAPTIAELASVLRVPADLVPRGPVVPLGGRGDMPPLFLIHGLGGQVFRFEPLARRLRDTGPVYAIAARGFGDGERPHTTLSAMADDYAERIRAVHPEGPYLLGGFCIGGNIAVEVARRLRAAGQDVPLVAVFWSHAAQPVLAESLNDETTLMMHALAGRKLDVDLDAVRGLPVEEQLLAVVNAASSAHHLTPSAVDLDQARRILDVYRANAHAAAAHRIQPYDGDLALFLPEDDRALDGFDSGRWPTVTTGRFDVVPIPGTRSTSVREPLVATTARLFTDLVATRIPGPAAGRPSEQT
jgi:amino acid adenylation domain-containing protein